MTDAAPLGSQAGDPMLALTIATVRACIAFASGLFGSDVPPTLGPDTTVISAPLAADRLPDYAAHARTLLGHGAPPEENAAVPLLAACWPMRIREKDLPIICREINANNEPPVFEPVAELSSHPSRDEALRQAVLAFLPDVDNAGMFTYEVESFASCAAWTGDDLPTLRDWLVDHARPLDLIGQATALPRFYLPDVALIEGKRDRALWSAYGHVTALRYAARDLAIRSMWHLGEGRAAAAWHDVLAIHKLARLATGGRQHAALVSFLIAGSISNSACRPTLRLLDTPNLSAAEIATIHHDLSKLPIIVDRGRLMEFDRLATIAWVVDLTTVNRLERPEKISDDLWNDDPGTLMMFFASVDWNIALTTVNRFFDAFDRAISEPEWATRRESLAAFQLRIREATGDAVVSSPAAGVFALFSSSVLGVNKATVLTDLLKEAAIGFRSLRYALSVIADERAARSERIGAFLSRLLIDSAMTVDTTVTRAEAELALTRMAAALAVWRSGKGRGNYPERLEDLVPEILAKMPTDPFTGKPFVYERRGDGYLLYSLGPNEKDDRGTAYNAPIVNGEWCDDTSHLEKPDATDLVVRLPIPKVPIMEQLRAARQQWDAARAKANQPTSQPGR